ncbi:MAG: AMP-binding protein [Cyclobacteriaceae bacterium]
MHQRITFSSGTKLLSEVLDHDHKGLSDFEKQALRIIHDWQVGENTFRITTSGSTGTPKEIILTRDQLQASAEKTIDYFGLTSSDTALVCINAEFIGGFMMIIRALIAGMNIILKEPTADPLDNVDIKSRPTFIAITPLQAQAFIQQPSRELLSEMKALIIGGGSIDPKTRRGFLDSPFPVYQTYGMTETISHIALKPLHTSGGVYHVLSGIKINNKNQGRLAIKIDENTPWIMTNDVVELIDDRSFEWIGRTDNVINSGGIKIHPEVIELKIQEELNLMGMKGRFFLHGVADEGLGQKAVLFFEGQIDDGSKILDRLKEVLPKYKNPKELISMDRFVNTPTGKIRREATVRSYFKR